MAHIEESNSGGRKQVVDLNLVPFIDLMSVCIIFLLITAVWTQVSMIQLGSSIYSNKTDDEPIKPPPFAEVVLRVDVLQKGFRLVVGTSSDFIPIKADGEYDKETLVARLKNVKTQYPDKMDGMTSVRDDVQYKHLIEAMDSLVIAGFEQVSISATGVQ